ncbi:MAG: hypothetical protein ACKVOK_05135, partial [Flavobacteriales bacterium]
MKNSFLILLLLFNLNAFSQRNEFQIRIGSGYGSFNALTDWNYTAQGIAYTDDDNESFTKILPHAELKYYIAKAHLTFGLHISAGLRATTSDTEASYDLARIGFGIDYAIIDKPNFRLFAGIQPTYRALAIDNGVYLGEDPPYDLSTVWSGLSVAANAGVLYYFKDSWFGVHANAGWEGGKLPLTYILFDDTEQSKDNTEATVT